MIKDNEFYIVLKLTSGEQIMAVLQEEDEDHVLIDNPMVMRTIMNFEAGKEHITASPLCAFTDEQSFVIPKCNILFIKKLHHVFIPHYQKIVSDHMESTLFSPADSTTGESLLWDDEPPSIEEARKMKKMLEDVLGIEEEDKPSPKSVFVEGNDTIN
jgi:hypothetical protein